MAEIQHNAGKKPKRVSPKSLANLTGGSRKGKTNKVTAQLKDMILTALNEANPNGGVGYLKEQARDNPVAFLSLVGKVLPMTVTGDLNHTFTGLDVTVRRASDD